MIFLDVPGENGLRMSTCDVRSQISGLQCLTSDVGGFARDLRTPQRELRTSRSNLRDVQLALRLALSDLQASNFDLRTAKRHNILIMTDTTTLISALETAPGVIVPLIREVPEAILRRRLVGEMVGF